MGPEESMSDFKNFLQQIRTDPSVSLHEFCRYQLLALIDTIKKKEKCSALKKEVVKMAPSLLVKREALEAALEDRVSYDDVDRIIQELRYEFLGDPLKFTINGIDPETLRLKEKEISEFPDDPDLTEIETGIHYEITIRWEGGAPERVCNSLEKIYVEHMRLFICVPEKLAGAALLVAMSWIDDPTKQRDAEYLIPKEMLLVSTGRCFEESKDIKIVKSDRIHVFNKSARLFQAKNFDLLRKSDKIIYRSRTET